VGYGQQFQGQWEFIEFIIEASKTSHMIVE